MQQRLDLARRAQEAAAKQLAAVAASRRRMQLRHIAQRLAADAASCGADGNKSPGAVGAVAGPPGGYAAPLEQQLSRSSCGDGRWVRGSGGDDGARGGHGAGGCRGRAGAARRRQREVKRASMERRLRIAPAPSDRTSGFERRWPADLSKLDLNWVTFFVNHGEAPQRPKGLSGSGGCAP